ncbi:MAG: hypothetical protein KIT61_00680 [Pyrinomonadaceae bacterium]|nr:hypothetical protein [Pyrinomonadaceae bacterium]
MNASPAEARPMESVRVLLSGIIDYAGLFPPSQVSMPEAVINYATYRNSNYGWMLGRFVVPVARLDEFIESARDFVSRDGKSTWHLCVTAGEDINDTIRKVRDFNRKNAPGVFADLIEVKANTVSKIDNTVAALPEGVTAYFEIATGDALPDLVTTLSLKGQKAKIRTGGVSREDFPSSKHIIRFVRTCMAANVPFKATAGLHHPIRCFKPLTYAEDAPQGTMHGFLNMLLMTGFARESYRVSLLEEMMEEEFEEVFQFSELGVKWRSEHFLSNAHLGWLRQKGMHSFGSCSFDEPIADLQALGLL